MKNFILILVIAVVVIFAVAYIVKEKKKGKKCIGCPMASTCKNSENCQNGKSK